MSFLKLLYQLRALLCLILLVGYNSCSTSSPDDVEPLELSDLVIDVQVVGESATDPNGNGSGKINLSFSANNAEYYRINFGDGETRETSANSLSYTYVGAGTHTYQIFVSAYKGNKFISQEISFTIFVSSALIFADEFNSSGAPNSSKWGYDLGAGGWGNNEAQYYTRRPENVIVENGVLKITARKENYEGADYTSARLLTQGKFSFTYGKVEVRAKLPVGGGTWPAIWMLGSNFPTAGWPACGEIDIMEHVGNQPGHVSSAIHTPSSYGGTVNYGATTLENVSSQFHIYSVEWTADKIQFAVDGNVFYTYNPTTKNASTWPFNSDQFLILNIAMGGSLGGTIDPNFNSGTMEIDYVRVYK